MSDPVTEAVRRAIGPEVGLILPPHSSFHYAENAAREALKPIREWSERHSGECSWIDELLDDLAPLIYTIEEMK
ncbi:hypothetical protein PBI_GAIA_57 [Mycobacterium phage Gaia]|uniref:Uncharacterized protein n=1 Tax=Mycobacterium phage Gaia TaxID=1486472 RepID=A0A068F4K6_9CAUD|nr:hypothetical protein VC46_gp176 [Mycobacterium phage Gaia]AID58876.1 hypothetical protein PBI_GAIA_57 [Mycobacterium phage Gaia]